jgi:HAD superfamily hydrolase (TIGR01549 family)
MQERTRCRAVILDLDGTLYRQTMLRLMLLHQMVHHYARSPRKFIECLRAIRAYRKALELMRDQSNGGDVETCQVQIACNLSGLSPVSLRGHVQTWMEQEPLAVLRECLRPGVEQFLKQAKSEGVRLGLFSDYAAEWKLKAMGLWDYFEVVLTARQADVNSLKPDPAGLVLCSERLRVNRESAIYVGDRPEIDAETARRAGIRCLIVGRQSRATDSWTGIDDFFSLTWFLGLH